MQDDVIVRKGGTADPVDFLSYLSKSNHNSQERR